MTVIGALSSFREPGEISPHKRASHQSLISSRQADFPVLISSMSGLAIYYSSRRSWPGNWQRSLAQRAGNTSRTGSNGNPHPPAPDARASAVTARAPAQVAVAL
jgi:hypothetical protein